MITDINSEDRLVQQTFAEHLEKVLGWNSVYAYNAETFGPNGTLGRISERDGCWCETCGRRWRPSTLTCPNRPASRPSTSSALPATSCYRV